MSVDETEEALIDPKTRITKQITLNDLEGTHQLFEDLMGTKVLPRKEYIKLHAEEATYNAE